MTLFLPSQHLDSPLDLALLPPINRRQEILHNIGLPVVHSPVSFDLLSLVIHILDIEPCVIREFAEPDFVVFFIQRFLFFLLLDHQLRTGEVVRWRPG